MWIPMTKQFRAEKEKYDLRGCCEECRYYCEQKDKCAMLYPLSPHRKKHFEEAKEGERIYFCKMFEVQ